MTRIDVDFNAVGRDGLIRISRRRADGDFVAGDIVELYDASEPDMAFPARVEEVDGEGRGLARVEWQDAQPSGWLNCGFVGWSLPDRPDTETTRPAMQVPIPATPWVTVSATSDLSPVGQR